MKWAATLAVVAVAGFSISAAVEAADNGFPAYFSEPPAVPQFGGFYVGAIGGYTFGTAEISSPLVPGVVLEDDLAGIEGGGVIGYDLQNGSFSRASSSWVPLADRRRTTTLA